MKMHFTKMLTVCCAIIFGAFITTQAFAQGSTCETALDVTPGTYTADGPSDGVSSPICDGTVGAFADWYSFTPASNGLITVGSCGGGADTQLSIFSGSCAALNCEDSNDDDDGCVSSGTSEFASRVSDLPVIGGTTYYIQWDNDWTTNGFDWFLEFSELSEPDCEGTPGGLALPGTACDDNDAGTINDTWDADCNCVGIPVASNDTPCTATALACGDTVADQNFIGATAFGVDDCSGTGTADVYFSFTADGNQTYTIEAIDQDGTFFDGVVELLSGPCNDLTVVGACLDFPERYEVTEAGDYIFRVRPWSSSETDQFSVSLICTPFDCPGVGNIGDACDDGDAGTVDDEIQEDCTCAGTPVASNDTPCTATALACGDTLLDESLAGATAFGTDDCSGSGVADVYFSFSSDGSQTYRVAVLDPSFSFDGVVELLEGSDCTDLAVVGACDDFPEEFTVTDAGNYYFRVRAFSSSETDGFDITLECIPFDCPELGGNIGDSCDDGNPATSGDIIQADCTCAGIGAAENDTPCTATLLACDQTITGETLAAATASSPSGCDIAQDNDLWYKVEVDSDGVRFDQIDSGDFMDAFIEVYEEGADCEDLIPVVTCQDFDDDFLDGVTITDAGTYYIRILGETTGDVDAVFDVTLDCLAPDCPGLGNIGDACDDGNPDTFDDTVQADCTCAGTPVDCPGLGNIGDACDDNDPNTSGETVQEDCTCGGGIEVPTNDICDGATALACGDSLDGTTEGANPFINTPSGCGFSATAQLDVWYSFEANGNDNYTVSSAGGTGFDGVLYVYSGACGDLTEVGCSDATFGGGVETVELIAPAAGTYYVQVYDFSGFGTFTMSLECAFNCTAPFPAVDEESINTTFLGNAYLLEWGAVEGQIGCQIQLRFADGEEVGRIVRNGADASSFTIPGSLLQFATDYEWRVRCGCSVGPIVAGPFSAWQPFTTPGSAISSMPNPTVGQSNVTFTVVEEGYTTLEVFDMSGRLVDAIFTGMAQPNNEYRFEFDGSTLPNGVYIYRLTTESEVLNNKFMIAK